MVLIRSDSADLAETAVARAVLPSTILTDIFLHVGQLPVQKTDLANQAHLPKVMMTRSPLSSTLRADFMLYIKIDSDYLTLLVVK